MALNCCPLMLVQREKKIIYVSNVHNMSHSAVAQHLQNEFIDHKGMYSFNSVSPSNKLRTLHVLFKMLLLLELVSLRMHLGLFTWVTFQR